LSAQKSAPLISTYVAFSVAIVPLLHAFAWGWRVYVFQFAT